MSTGPDKLRDAILEFAELRIGVGSQNLRSMTNGKGIVQVFTELYDAAVEANGWDMADVIEIINRRRVGE